MTLTIGGVSILLRAIEAVAPGDHFGEPRLYIQTVSGARYAKRYETHEQAKEAAQKVLDAIALNEAI